MPGRVHRQLTPGDVIDARITHIEPFGVLPISAAASFHCFPIDSISVSRIEHPRERFLVEWISVLSSNPETATELPSLIKNYWGPGKKTQPVFALEKLVGGIIRSIENYGVFVELTPNLAGLAEVKENIFPGQQASVFIKKVFCLPV